MSNITNLLQGNFLKLSESSITTCLLQSNYENEQIADKLYDYHFNVSFNDPVYNLILIDFGLDWLSEHKQALNNKIQVGNQNIYKLAEKKFGIFVSQDYQVKHKDNLNPLTLMKKNNIEVLEVFFDKEDLALFFYELTNNTQQNSLVKQITIKVKQNTISPALHESLQIIATSMIKIESELLLKETNEITTKYVILQLTQKKQTGYSFQQLYKMHSDQFNKGQLQIEKITNVNDLVQQYIEKNEEKDLKKVFNTTFSVQMSQQQKKQVNDLQEINPHFEAMQIDRNWNNFDERLIDQKKANLKAHDKSDLIHLEGEDVDQEVEDEDDFDV